MELKNYVYNVNSNNVIDDTCPFDLSIIPNYMGINLNSVNNIMWSKTPYNELVSLTINFIPTK